MNTNSNVYTVIYTTIVVVVVAAVLAFTATRLRPAQDANAKAETLRQMMAAAQIKPTGELYAARNAEVLGIYSDNIAEAFTVDLQGRKVGELSTASGKIELVDKLKPQNTAIKAGEGATLPVYRFKSGITVVPVYGAGLWGPVWGYLALQSDGRTIAGAYFDHEGETPGLGAKIKDEPWFREQFVGKVVDLDASGNPFDIVKGGAGDDASKVDAITGATMTSKGLDQAIDVWISAYVPYLRTLTNSEEE